MSVKKDVRRATGGSVRRPVLSPLKRYINLCSCGKILTRNDGETVHCFACGAEWDGDMLRLPSGLPRRDAE